MQGHLKYFGERGLKKLPKSPCNEVLRTPYFVMVYGQREKEKEKKQTL